MPGGGPAGNSARWTVLYLAATAAIEMFSWRLRVAAVRFALRPSRRALAHSLIGSRGVCAEFLHLTAGNEKFDVNQDRLQGPRSETLSVHQPGENRSARLEEACSPVCAPSTRASDCALALREPLADRAAAVRGSVVWSASGVTTENRV